MVSLASVNADEGYIPYFPDFMEPDGIGFRDNAEFMIYTCWTTHSSECSYPPPESKYFKSRNFHLASTIAFIFPFF